MIKIIAVDDEVDAKILFEHFFRKEIREMRVSLSFVHTAEECLRLLREVYCADNVCQDNILVVTDINMPEVNGIQLAEKINQECPTVKVFLISAYEARSQLGDIQRLNVAEYISKPVDFEELKAKIFNAF